MSIPRKTRYDAGTIMATQRDQYCIAWIAEQYAGRFDQIQRLLSRFPDRHQPFKGELIAETTVRDQISRWRRAGWIEYQRILADQPGFAWVTRRGLQLVALDDIYTARAPASVRLDHLYAVNQVRLFLDKQYTWKSERRFRSELDPKKIKDVAIPDGLISTKEGLVAIEVEISAKKSVEMEHKLRRLIRQSSYYLDMEYGHAYAAIWFYVPTSKIEGIVERAANSLSDDEQKRLTIGIVSHLLPSRFR